MVSGHVCLCVPCYKTTGWCYRKLQDLLTRTSHEVFEAMVVKAFELTKWWIPTHILDEKIVDEEQTKLQRVDYHAYATALAEAARDKGAQPPACFQNVHDSLLQ